MDGLLLDSAIREILISIACFLAAWILLAARNQ